MNPVARSLDLIHDLGQSWVLGKFALFHGLVDAGIVLIDNATRANIEVPDLGITHLAFR